MKRKPQPTLFFAPTHKDGSPYRESSYSTRVHGKALDVEGWPGKIAVPQPRKTKRTLRVRKCTPPRLTTKGS